MRDTLRDLIREMASGWEPGQRTRAGQLSRIIRLQDQLIPLYLELERLNRLAAGMPRGPEREEIMRQIPEVAEQIKPLQAELERQESKLGTEY